MSSTVFGAEMENYQGDLNDIVRASAHHHPSDNILPWQQQFPSADPLNFSSSSNAFGDPFSAIRDPLDLLHEPNVIATGSGSRTSTYFSSHNNSANHHMINMEDTSNFSAADNSTVGGGGVLDDMTSPCSVFSRIQITQTSSPLSMPPPCDLPEMVASRAGGGGGGHKGTSMFPSDMINVKGCLNIDNTGTGTASVPVQISSPRNLGIKRRKSQAKKVVCIPAPAAANSRSSGEVVPSDLWAWRKYGQKPIKGSPYPRGYYRCSSSKGCSARKQVERSRTDPNMLVITYTSEHNHPWPTQRNALAGSTRSQPSKSNTTTGSKTGSPSTINTSVKEEMEMEDDQELAEFGEGIPQTNFRPAIGDFFAELDEIETTDPLNLLFQQGFNCDGDQQRSENKHMDPISLFDWSGNNNI